MVSRGGALVEARGIGKQYVDGPAVVRVLADLDLDVMPGERIAIVGASGIGKSTLLHLLGTLDHPTAGTICFDGVDLSTRSANELASFRNREIGFVFQFHHLLGDFTALENVMLPALIAREPLRSARARAEELLDRVGLHERLEHRPGALSGGEQQRVAVARAVMQRPRLLLADEPTGNLDPATGGAVQQLLLDLNQEHGSALVVATHNADLATSLGRTLRMEAGRLVEEDGALGAARRGGASL
jgi:lipoprotein-releasing system ATP-binding protein